MAQIRIYDAQVSPAGPVRVRGGRGATGADFGSGVARAIGGAGTATEQLGNFLQAKKEDDDQSNVRSLMSGARLTLTEDMIRRQEEAAPGAEGFTDGFKADFDSFFEKSRESVQTESGRQLFDQRKAELRASFTIKALTFEASSRAEKRKSDVAESINAGQNTLLSDPDQLTDILAETVDNVNSLRVSADDKKSLIDGARQDLGKSAAQGLIRVNPELAEAQLKGGIFDEFLDADAKTVLIGQARTGIRALATEQRLADTNARKQQEVAIKARADEFLIGIQNDEVEVQDVLDDPTLDFTRRRQLLTVLEKQAKGDKFVTNPTVFLELFNRVHADDDDPGKITNEDDLFQFLGEGLTFEDLKRLRKEVTDLTRDTPEDKDRKKKLASVKKRYLVGQKSLVTGSTSFQRDPQGDSMFFLLQQEVDRIVEQTEEASEDPFALFDPQSKQFLGNLGSDRRFRRSLTEIMRDQAAAIRGTPVESVDTPEARRPNETTDDYLKRIGGQ